MTNVPWPYPSDGAHTFIAARALPAMERGEMWVWTLRLKSAPDAVIGQIDLTNKEGLDNRGFWIAAPWQGLGLMTEAVNAVTGFWFDTLGFPVLRTSKAAANTASRRISEKQGMRLVAVEERNYVSGRQPGEVWEITAEEWRARRAGNGRSPLGE